MRACGRWERKTVGCEGESPSSGLLLSDKFENILKILLVREPAFKCMELWEILLILTMVLGEWMYVIITGVGPPWGCSVSFLALPVCGTVICPMSFYHHAHTQACTHKSRGRHKHKKCPCTYAAHTDICA